MMIQGKIFKVRFTRNEKECERCSALAMIQHYVSNDTRYFEKVLEAAEKPDSNPVFIILDDQELQNFISDIEIFGFAIAKLSL